MDFKGPIQDVIRHRTSIRTYRKEAIGTSEREQLESFLTSHNQGLFGQKTRFLLVAANNEDPQALKGLGTYGFIKNPPAFVIGAVQESETDMEDFGYATQRAILFATELGLGTCWLGGTFNKSRFSERIAREESERVPAVFAVGQRKSKRGTVERVIRWGAGAKNRKPWEEIFFLGDFDTPLESEAAGKFAEPLEMIRLAPSSSNKQPWRIVKETDRDVFHFFLRRSAKYNRMMNRMKLADLPRVDMGIAMCHFDLATKEAGIVGEWRRDEPDAELPERMQYISSWLSA